MKQYLQEPCNFVIEDIINIIYIETTSNWILDNLTTDEFWVLAYTVGGEAKYRWNNQNFCVRQGDTMLFQQGFSRSAQSASYDPWKFIVVKFGLQPCNNHTREILAGIANICQDQRTAMEQLFTELERIWHSKMPGYIIRCKGLLYTVLYDLMRDSGQFVNQAHPHGKALQRVVQKINENVNKNFKVSELAREAGMSESYFRAMFKSYSGYSVVQYQNFIKISYARDLLLSGNYRVNEVAAAVGISDVYYFSRLFTKIVGTNPSSLFQ